VASYEPEQDVEAAKGGDREAQGRIVWHMTGAVKQIARHYASRYRFLAYDDLVQEGHMAVLRCTKRWRFGEGTKFSTYAYQAIRNRAWILAKRTRVLLQLEEPGGKSHERWAGSIEGSLEEIAEDRSGGRATAVEVFRGLGWDRCRVLLARLRPVLEGRKPRPWATIARMENIPARQCRALFAEAVAMVREAHGEVMDVLRSPP
jgi:DNA-directed RNA polymerase specialized sigma24 family protein